MRLACARSKSRRNLSRIVVCPTRSVIAIVGWWRFVRGRTPGQRGSRCREEIRRRRFHFFLYWADEQGGCSYLAAGVLDKGDEGAQSLIREFFSFVQKGGVVRCGAAVCALVRRYVRYLVMMVEVCF